MNGFTIRIRPFRHRGPRSGPVCHCEPTTISHSDSILYSKDSTIPELRQADPLWIGRYTESICGMIGSTVRSCGILVWSGIQDSPTLPAPQLPGPQVYNSTSTRCVNLGGLGPAARGI